MAKVCCLPAPIFLTMICCYLLGSEEAPEEPEDDEEGRQGEEGEGGHGAGPGPISQCSTDTAASPLHTLTR